MNFLKNDFMKLATTKGISIYPRVYDSYTLRLHLSPTHAPQYNITFVIDMLLCQKEALECISCLHLLVQIPLLFDITTAEIGKFNRPFEIASNKKGGSLIFKCWLATILSMYRAEHYL